MRGSHTTELTSGPALPLVQLPDNVHSLRTWFLPLPGETQIELQAPGFSLLQPQMLRAFGRSLSSLSFSCLPLPFKSVKKIVLI